MRPGIVGLAGGFSSWTNPVAMFPVGSYVISVLGLGVTLRRTLSAAVALFISISMFFIPSIFGYSTGLEWKIQYLDKQGADISNLFSGQAVLEVAASFFAFSIVSPLNFVMPTYTFSDISGYFANPLRGIVFAWWILIYIHSVIYILRDGTKRILFTSLFLPIVCLVIFYVYFQPNEAMLYTPLTLVPIFLIVGLGSNDSRVSTVLFAIFIGLLALTNVKPLYETSVVLSPRSSKELSALRQAGLGSEACRETAARPVPGATRKH
jgi:hypothetical protein